MGTFAPVGGGMILWNPTDEDMEMQYSGSSFVMVSGEKREFENSCAAYILNSYGARGITSLKYGDEKNEGKIGADAIERNKEFKKRQVTQYNIQNENRKHMNLGYLPPTALMKKYALELGLKLLEPYTVRDEERAGIAKATSENEELKKKLAAQETAMAEMKTMMEQLLANQEAAKKPGPMVRDKDGKWVKEK